jgi:cytochrome c biogenesis protein CcmG/thiol:disulfide interchange protein DsbE
MRGQVILTLICLLLSSCAGLPSFLNSPSPEIGALAPDFTLWDLQGKETSLRDLRGQVVLLNFWATWCGPCREEMPTIEERYNDGGFALFAINFDESVEIVQGYMNELGIDIPVLLDPGGKVQDLYRLRGYPTSFFIDQDGVIRFIQIGEMTADDLDNYLEQITEQP